MKTVQYIYKCDNGTNFYWAVKPKELVKIKINPEDAIFRSSK